jgi:hypothetical protein
MHSSRRSSLLARCRAAHRPIDPSSPLAEPCRIEHDTVLFGPAGERHALRLLGWAAVPIGPCARTCTRPHTDAARAQLRIARAPSAAAAAAAAAAGMLLLLLLLLLHPSPLEDPNLQGPHQSTRGLEPRRALVRTPPCAHNFGTRALATAWSGAGEPRLSERISSPRCAESCQTLAASKGFERDAICETEESEAAGADSTKGRRRHKGA